MCFSYYWTMMTACKSYVHRFYSTTAAKFKWFSCRQAQADEYKQESIGENCQENRHIADPSSEYARKHKILHIPLSWLRQVQEEQGIHDETPDDEWISNPWPVLTPARRPTSYERVFLGVNFFARFEMGPSAHKNACKEHLPCPIPVKLPSFNFSSSSLDVLPPSRSSFNDDPPPRSGDFVLPQSAASLDSTATSQVCFDPDLIDHLDFPAPLNAGDDVSSSLPRPLHRAPIFTRTSLPRETSWAMLNLRTRRPLSALTTEDHRRNSETLPRVQQRKKHHGRRPTVQSAEDVKEESGLLSRIKRALSRKLKL